MKAREVVTSVSAVFLMGSSNQLRYSIRFIHLSSIAVISSSHSRNNIRFNFYFFLDKSYIYLLCWCALVKYYFFIFFLIEKHENPNSDIKQIKYDELTSVLRQFQSSTRGWPVDRTIRIIAMMPFSDFSKTFPMCIMQ